MISSLLDTTPSKDDGGLITANKKISASSDYSESNEYATAKEHAELERDSESIEYVEANIFNPVYSSLKSTYAGNEAKHIASDDLSRTPIAQGLINQTQPLTTAVKVSTTLPLTAQAVYSEVIPAASPDLASHVNPAVSTGIDSRTNHITESTLLSLALAKGNDTGLANSVLSQIQLASLTTQTTPLLQHQLVAQSSLYSQTIQASQLKQYPLGALPQGIPVIEAAPQRGQTQQVSQFTMQVSATPTNFTHLQLAALELGATESAEANTQALALNGIHRSQTSQWGPLPLSAGAPQLQQAQELLTPLKQQLKFQIDQQIKQADIRLDPPELGKIELSIRIEGDRLNIQMHAANSSVRDLLILSLDRLRAELAMDHGGQIDVDVKQGEKEQQKASSDEGYISIAKHDDLATHKNEQQELHHLDLLA